MFLEGKDGNASGNHFHISTGKGTPTGNGWAKNSNGKWGLGDISKHEEYFKSVLKFFSPINKPYQIELNFYSPVFDTGTLF